MYMSDPFKDIVRGMGSFDLFPIIPPYKQDKDFSPWRGVANSFAKTGEQMRAAIQKLNEQIKTGE
jgi:hypothetical protein